MIRLINKITISKYTHKFGIKKIFITTSFNAKKCEEHISEIQDQLSLEIFTYNEEESLGECGSLWKIRDQLNENIIFLKGTMMDGEDIKSMKLYNFIDRVYNELKEIGKEIEGDLSINELSSFDQLHYHGTESIDFAIEKLNISSNSKVLEIGSGIGGPARYIAKKTGAKVTALELQEDHHLVGIDLTKRCGLENNVEHLCGDFLDLKLPNDQYDTVVSWLALYHIPERDKLLETCMNLSLIHI